MEGGLLRHLTEGERHLLFELLQKLRGCDTRRA